MNIEYRAFVGQHDWGWMQQYLPDIKQTLDMRGITAVDLDTNETVAMAIFDNWLSNCTHAHIAIDKTMVARHGFFEEIGDYVFNFCQKDYMYAMVSESNKKSLGLVRHLGFIEKMRLPKAVNKDTDYIMLSVHKDDYTKMPTDMENAA